MFRGGSPASGIAAFTGGSITGVSGNQYDIAKWDIPVIQLGSGSMGNNGAATLTNALGTIYANCYVTVPAGAIATGVPAATDTYFAQFSSTTVAAIFNNRLADNLNSVGAPLIPASPAAFVTTGPGAFTGITSAVNVVTITIPAGAMGVSGECIVEGDLSMVNAATNKTISLLFGGSTLISTAQTTISSASPSVRIKNRGSASVQRSQVLFPTSASCTSPASVYLSVNTGNAVAVVYQLTKATATESLVFEGGRVAVIPT